MRKSKRLGDRRGKRLFDGHSRSTREQVDASGQSPFDDVGTVYVLLAQDPDLSGKRVKVGWTNRDPFKRMEACQTGSPIPLMLFAVYSPAMKCHEAELHDKLREAGKEIPGAGKEWFHFDAEAQNIIRSMCCHEVRSTDKYNHVQCPVCERLFQTLAWAGQVSCPECGCITQNRPAPNEVAIEPI